MTVFGISLLWYVCGSAIVKNETPVIFFYSTNLLQRSMEHHQDTFLQS